MFNKRGFIMKAFSKILTALISLLILSAFAVSCGNSAYKPYTFYKIQGDVSVKYYHGVDFKVNYAKDKIDDTYAKEMWINIADVDKTKGVDKITFKFYSKTSSGTWTSDSSFFGRTSTFSVDNKKENIGGNGVWLRVFDSMKITSSARNEFRILTDNEVKVNQIIILDADYKAVEFDKVTAVGGVNKDFANKDIVLDDDVSKLIKSATNMFNRPDTFVREEK